MQETNGHGNGPSGSKTGKGRGIKRRVLTLLGKLGLPLTFSVIYPLIIYYVVRAFGIDPFTALLAGAVPIVGFQLYTILIKQQIDLPGAGILAIVGGSIIMAHITGEERFMLARAGFLTAVVACCFLASLYFKRPMAYSIAAYLLQRMDVSAQHLASLWDTRPNYRSVWRLSTVIWGLGIFVNAAIILAMAYLLPVDIVPVLNTVVNLITFVALQFLTQYIYNIKGIWKLVFQERGKQDSG